MTTNIWQGQLVRLRGVELEDWEMFFEWDIDTDMARSVYYIPFPSSREATKSWVAELAAARPKNDECHCVIENLDGQAVGAIDTHSELGFREEGRLRRMVYTGGAYHDWIMLGMTREEFEEAERELGALEGKEQRTDGAEH